MPGKGGERYLRGWTFGPLTERRWLVHRKRKESPRSSILLTLSFTNQETDTLHAPKIAWSLRSEVITFPIWDEIVNQDWMQPRIGLSEERRSATLSDKRQRTRVLRVGQSPPMYPRRSSWLRCLQP